MLFCFFLIMHKKKSPSLWYSAPHLKLSVQHLICLRREWRSILWPMLFHPEGICVFYSTLCMLCTLCLPLGEIICFSIKCLCFPPQPNGPLVCPVQIEAERCLPHHNRSRPPAAGSRCQTPQLQGGDCYSWSLLLCLFTFLIHANLRVEDIMNVNELQQITDSRLPKIHC